MTQPAGPPEHASEELVRERIARVQEQLLAKFPQARFRLEPGEDTAIWHFSIYAEEGRLFLPMEVTQELNQMWMEHHTSIITTVYSLSAYQEKK